MISIRVARWLGFVVNHWGKKQSSRFFFGYDMEGVYRSAQHSVKKKGVSE